ncbi:MAG: hypothetical protein GXO87_11695 [Chlorobi bacterium]|nr:hypothetical protein [Chlorobiota bacterium]
MNKIGNTNLKLDENKNIKYIKDSKAKIFPLKSKPPFDLRDFKDWDIRIGDYESDTEAYSMRGETFMKVMKIIFIFFGIIALGASFYFALTLVGTL